MRRAYKQKARVADKRRAGIGNKRDRLAICESRNKFGDAGAFIVLMHRHKRRRNTEMREQFSGVPRVFGRNHINRFEYSRRAWREILEIADRRCDNEQRSAPPAHMV